MGDEGSYKIKRISFCGRQDVPVFCQNNNGPCPLLAIVNCLSLRNQLQVSAGATEMSNIQLMTLVAERILDSNATPMAGRSTESAAFEENLRANISDSMEALSKLGEPGNTGMDVNIRFNSPTGFELTREVAVFDLLGIPLLHGWLVDPQDVVTAPALGSKTYNQAVEQIITSLDSQPSFTGSRGSFKAPSFSASMQLNSPAKAPPQPQPPATTESDLLGLESLTPNPAPPPVQDSAPPPAGGLDDLFTDGPNTSSPAPPADAPPTTKPTPTSPPGAGDLLLFDGLDISSGTPPTNSPGPAPAAAPAAPPPLQPADSGPPPATQATSASKANRPPLHETLAIREFLEGTASQLTVYGITQLAGTLNENALAVFFRNNHFNCLFKYGRSLYLLITDQGYQSVNEVVWERLDAVDGDTQLCGPDFLPHKAPAQVPVRSHQINMEAFSAIPPEALAGLSEEDAAAIVEAAGTFLPPTTTPAARDTRSSTGGGDGGTYQPPAITWQGEQALHQGGAHVPQQHQQHYEPQRPVHGASVDADLALALQLQEEEMQEARRAEQQAQVRAQQQQQQQQQYQQQQQGQRTSANQQRTSAGQGQQYYNTGSSQSVRAARPVQAEPAKKEESSCAIM